jgi:predicted transcriptional regulator
VSVEGLKALARLVQALEDPRGTVYLALVNARRPVSRQRLQELTKLHTRTVDRALRFLYQKGLVDKIMGRQEVYYFAAP